MKNRYPSGSASYNPTFENPEKGHGGEILLAASQVQWAPVVQLLLPFPNLGNFNHYLFQALEKSTPEDGTAQSSAIVRCDDGHMNPLFRALI